MTAPDPFEAVRRRPGPLVLTAQGGFPVKEWGGYQIEVLVMAYNARLVMTPLDDPAGYDHGWCYRDVDMAVLAAVGWDPQTEDEPPGWHKRPTPDPRRAPDRDPAALVRCAHGTYPGAACHYIGCTP